MTKTTLDKIELRIHPKQSAIILEICGIVLSLISFFLQLAIYDFGSKKAAWWSPLFSLDIELSVPSLYQVFLFFYYCIPLFFDQLSKNSRKRALPLALVWCKLPCPDFSFR